MVVDGVSQAFEPQEAPLTQWANRHTGVGFRSAFAGGKAGAADVDFRYRIFNADGSEVEQCGNGARCFARFVADKGLSNKQEIRVETARGVIVPRLLDSGLVVVNMGKPRLMPSENPLCPQPARPMIRAARILCWWGSIGAAELCEHGQSACGVSLVDDVEHGTGGALGRSDSIEPAISRACKRGLYAGAG